MGYTKDDDFYTRGVGAIASRDRSRVRQVTTQIRRAQLAQRDQQMSKLAQLAGMGMVRAEGMGDVQNPINPYGPKLTYGGNVEGEQTSYAGSGMVSSGGSVRPLPPRPSPIIDPSRMGSAVTYQPQPKTLGGKPAPTPTVGPDDPGGDVTSGTQASGLTTGNTGIMPPSFASGIAGWSTQKKVVAAAAVAGGLYLLFGRGKK